MSRRVSTAAGISAGTRMVAGVSAEGTRAAAEGTPAATAASITAEAAGNFNQHPLSHLDQPIGVLPAGAHFYESTTGLLW